ncbi:GDP-L-galactose phosphorylase 1-like protein [Corchorus capsularis]|uniref:GDP-D-glucose phosphorylase 1 n=1 Tax=Corchorus capsularis TaxID=210143 RepID=A0A1R3GBR1_COCAP|nr:GDP-L-galactose phosphorylase 1-like protein [Corchorus capsularis]
MLTIKRVATVLSNYQDDGYEIQEVGCGRNCLGNCCLPASTLPLYTFKKNQENSGEPDEISPFKEEQPHQLSFLNLLLGEWEERMRQGLFRYDVTNCVTKIIPGKYGFIAQLNEGRHLKKRPTEFRVDQVLQPFDDSKFNFTKVGQEEVLFRFEQSNNYKSHYFLATALAVTADGNNSPNVVAINVSPIEYGHVLLIPHVVHCLPQRIDHSSFLLAINFAKEAANPFFRVGYNILGAFATINHLYFQAYFLEVPFPIEEAPIQRILFTKKRVQDRGVIISKLLDYPVKGFVFEGGNSVQDLSHFVASACICLQNTNIPFNVLISDSGKRIFLLPQCYAERQALGEVRQELLESQVNPAVWEIGGHIVLKRHKDYDNSTEESAWRLLAEVSLSEERFQEVKAYVREAAGLQEKPNMKENKVNLNQVKHEANQKEDSLCKQPAAAKKGYKFLLSVVQACILQRKCLCL